MKYSKMVKFLNDNGICVMQPVIANEVDSQLEHSIPEDEFEDICKSVEALYLGAFDEPDIWELVNEELKKRGLIDGLTWAQRERLQYLKAKEKVCPLDKDELYELTMLEGRDE